MSHFELIVIGCGAMGSAAVLASAKSGHTVLGIDRWTPPHGRGSSHGQTRVIRQAYFEHPDYVPLLLHSYSLWRELEVESQEQLLFETGILEIGRPDGFVIPGVLHSAKLHELDVESLTADEVRRWFPRYRVPEGYAAVFERTGGYLRAEACISAMLRVAAGHGAKFQFDTAVQAIRNVGTVVEVIAGDKSWTAERIIFTPGSFTSGLVAAIKPEGIMPLPLTVQRQQLHWFDCDLEASSMAHESHSEPVFFYETTDGCFYGFPPLADRPGATGRLKVAQHGAGETIADPATVDRSLVTNELSHVKKFMDEHLNGRYTHVEHQVCMYTMTPDANFILDFHSSDHRIVFGCGFSGHGFKFAPVIGEVLVEMAIRGTYCPATLFLKQR